REELERDGVVLHGAPPPGGLVADALGRGFAGGRVDLDAVALHGARPFRLRLLDGAVHQLGGHVVPDLRLGGGRLGVVAGRVERRVGRRAGRGRRRGRLGRGLARGAARGEAERGDDQEEEAEGHGTRGSVGWGKDNRGIEGGGVDTARPVPTITFRASPQYPSPPAPPPCTMATEALAPIRVAPWATICIASS